MLGARLKFPKGDGSVYQVIAVIAPDQYDNDIIVRQVVRGRHGTFEPYTNDLRASRRMVPADS